MGIKQKFRDRERKCDQCGYATPHRIIEKDTHNPDKMTLRCTKCGTVIKIDKREDVRKAKADKKNKTEQKGEPQVQAKASKP